FNNGLQVIVKDGMRIVVKIGDANINGYRYTNESEKVIEVTNADGVLDRIDNIVVRLDLPNRQITTEIVTGSFSENAMAPNITRGSSIYELRIAKISIPAGTTEITEDLITDTRFDNNDCGNVICAVQTPDFTDILQQYIALWDKFITSRTSDFDKWMGELKETLSGDVAANLLTLIQKVEKEKADMPRSKTITLLANRLDLK
ncbi:MAG: hypothetical protein K2H53_02125, partial [Clostridia bacterium]|nr:hypothetical protein [Clostridia bacterium]